MPHAETMHLQEHATKHFRIFNPVDDVMAEESVCSEDESSKDMVSVD